MLDPRRVSRLLLAIGALFLSACDLVARNGTGIRLASAGTVFGSPGHFVAPAHPAITLLRGGSVAIEDGSVVGGAYLVASADPFAGTSAPGIRAEGGRVVLQGGTIAGGALLFQGPDGARSIESSVGFAGSGIAGRNVRVEISGGRVVGGDIVLGDAPEGQGPSFGGALTPSGAALTLEDSEILISGGTFDLGAKQVLVAFTARSVLEIDTSAVAILGGEFRGGRVDLGAGQNLIAGGRFELGVATGSPKRFTDADAPPPGCTEIRAGVIPRLDIDGGETVFLFGTDFNLPAGDVVFPTDAEIGFPARLRLGPFTVGRFVDLSGRYGNGSPFTLLARVAEDSRLVLASPGEPGCPD